MFKIGDSVIVTKDPKEGGGERSGTVRGCVVAAREHTTPSWRAVLGHNVHAVATPM